MPTVREGVDLEAYQREERERELSKQVPACEVRERNKRRQARAITGNCVPALAPCPCHHILVLLLSLLVSPFLIPLTPSPRPSPISTLPNLSLSSHSHSFSFAKVREPFTLLPPRPPSALLSGRRFIISNQPIVVSPHRLIKGHSPKRGFAPSSWLRAILAHIHHHHF